MMRRNAWLAMILHKGEIVEILDPADNCHPYYPTDRCGGCPECMIMQAEYYDPGCIWWVPKNPEHKEFFNYHY